MSGSACRKCGTIPLPTTLLTHLLIADSATTLSRTASLERRRTVSRLVTARVFGPSGVAFQVRVLRLYAPAEYPVGEPRAFVFGWLISFACGSRRKRFVRV